MQASLELKMPEGPPHAWIYLQELQVLTLKMEVCVVGKSSCSGWGSGKVNILKYTLSTFHNKILHSKENYILESF